MVKYDVNVLVRVPLRLNDFDASVAGVGSSFLSFCRRDAERVIRPPSVIVGSALAFFVFSWVCAVDAVLEVDWMGGAFVDGLGKRLREEVGVFGFAGAFEVGIIKARLEDWGTSLFALTGILLERGVGGRGVKGESGRDRSCSGSRGGVTGAGGLVATCIGEVGGGDKVGEDMFTSSLIDVGMLTEISSAEDGPRTTSLGPDAHEAWGVGESSIRASFRTGSMDGRVVNLNCCFDLEGDRDGDDNSFRSTKGMGPTGTERALWRPGVTALDLVDGNDDKEDGFFGNPFWTRRETSFSESLPSRFCLFNTLSHSTRESFSGEKGRLWRPVESASGVTSIPEDSFWTAGWLVFRRVDRASLRGDLAKMW